MTKFLHDKKTFFSLNVNLYNFLDKKNIEYKKAFLQHFSNHTIHMSNDCVDYPAPTTTEIKL